ncbi:hypothetical protein [Mesorhizobium sp. CO1-1-8]|uniref:hypothetical protein n=1 Tax=Mesorhizobium sp. CO1-1-8 TaxID=2876631 RepID=UPI001CD1679B|nr:hypothetical protein [Mesorhizobium sp. CO1-1-8]MBZ9772322.1 hypothetical protein [Mesorhizobium sp. CO1-1-8]
MNRGAIVRALVALFVCAWIAGCGTTTPKIQEFWGTYQDAGFIEQKLVGQVSCELRQAVYKLYHDNPARYSFLKDWLAQVELLLTVEEKSALSPGAMLIDPGPTQTFSLGVGGSWANTATRADKIYVTYKVNDFINLKKHDYDCQPEPNRASLFIQSDLHLYDWLRGAISVAVAEGPESNVGATAKFAGRADALSHDIKFQIVTSGNVTPTWKLVRFATTSSPFASASRDRAQELIVTLAPPDKAHPDQLGPIGTNSSLSSDLAAAVRRSTQ